MVEPPSAPALVSLERTVEPLREHFNATPGARFVALLSPTSEGGIDGVVAIREAILRGFPDAKIGISIVWVDVLDTDDEAAALRLAGCLADRRVTHFYDPKRRAATVFAFGLLNKPPAWNVHLFYPRGARWDRYVPPPSDWMHQLAEPLIAARARGGVDLARDLHAALANLGFTPAGPPPDEARLVATRAELARLGIESAQPLAPEEPDAGTEPADTPSR